MEPETITQSEQEIINAGSASHAEDEKCPVHEIDLTEGFCEFCQVCYSCK